MKKLPPYIIGCKTQIALILLNIFKEATLSCYIIVKNPLCLIKIFLNWHNHLNGFLHRIESTKLTCSLWRKYAT